MDFYDTMLSQLGVPPANGQQAFMQQPQYSQPSPWPDQGIAPSYLDSVFGLPQLGGLGVDFGDYSSTYTNDPTGGYDHQTPNQAVTQAPDPNGYASTAGLFGIESDSNGMGNSYSPYTY